MTWTRDDTETVVKYVAAAILALAAFVAFMWVAWHR